MDFRQNELTNEKWAEKFNLKVDAAAAIGMQWKHPVLLEHVATELHNKSYDTLNDDQKEEVEEDAEERCSRLLSCSKVGCNTKVCEPIHRTIAPSMMTGVPRLVNK